MTKTDFYNLSQPQQKAERLRQYAEFFNTKANDYENKQRTIQGAQGNN
jgi:hypothetical protein